MVKSLQTFVLLVKSPQTFDLLLKNPVFFFLSRQSFVLLVKCVVGKSADYHILSVKCGLVNPQTFIKYSEVKVNMFVN